MYANFSKKNSLLGLAALFCLVGSFPALAQTPTDFECRIDVCYVKMTADGFLPESIIVKPGATIVWKNVDDRVHSLEIIAGQLRSDAVIISPGNSYSYTFQDEEGFTYFDAESGKSGTLMVSSTDESLPMVRPKVDFSDSRSGISDVSMTSGAVTGIEVIPEMRALLVNVEAESSNILQMTIHRDLLDSRALERDTPFSIRVGGNVAYYDEISTTSEDRTIRITLQGGTESILIRGNSIAAEPLGYQSAYSALSEAASVIAAYKEKGIVTREADDLLLQATDAALLGKYHFATDLANEAVTAAQRADRIAVVATTVMNEAETSIKTTKTLGGDVAQAEELLDHTREIYSYGGYEEALNLANYARAAALTKINPLVIIGAIGISAAAALYAYHRKLSLNGTPSTINMKKTDSPSLQSVFVDKPHLREDDRLVLKYIVDRGGEALLAEIRNQFNLPKSTAWRLMRRLEREELVEITKFGNQNMVRYKLKTPAQQ